MFNVYTSYFVSPSADRQAELDYCIQENLRNDCIETLTLFADEPASQRLLQLASTAGMDGNKLETVLLSRIPMYLDWLETAQQKNGISVFANADIYFDASLCQLNEYLSRPKSLVCLSRHNVTKDGTVVPHPRPKWSQDVWAINNDEIGRITFLDQLKIRIGLCRCDNQFAYHFAVRGWDLFNPMEHVMCYHKHASEVRTYDKKDLDIVGALAFVYPCVEKQPSKIEIEIMPEKNENIISCRLNNFLQNIVK